MKKLEQAFESTPSEIDGMDVLFDKRVTLFPVSLVAPGKPARARSLAAQKRSSRGTAGRLGRGLRGWR